MHRPGKTLATLATFVALALTTPLIAQNMEISSYNVTATGSINRGDFNNDGNSDVVFCAGSGFGVAFGKPNGQLQPPSYTGGVSCSGLAVADFNNDGKLDVAITSDFNNRTDVFFNNGNGTFTLAQELPTGGFDLNAGDFNNDGRIDLAVVDGSQNNVLDIYPGIVGGHFGTPTQFGTQIQQILKVRVADFDHDGKTDIVLSGNQITNNVEVLFNDGPFNFTHTLVGGDSVSLINPLDLNLDGYTDLLLSRSQNCVSNPKNTLCNYSFETWISSGATRSFNKTNSVAVSDPLGGLRDATAADVDGDGINDIVGVTKPGVWAMAVWHGHANGTYDATPTNYELGGSETTISIVQSDANRDGRPDFTVVNAGDFSHGLTRLINAVPRAACATDTGIGITGCRPTGFTYSLPNVRFVANAHDTRAAVTKFQLFIDNALKYSVASSHIDVTLNPVASGNHQVVFKAFNANGNSFLSPRTITVSPAAPGVVCSTPVGTARVCLPPPNTGGTGTYRILAAGYPPNTPTAVKLYLDGALIYSASTLQNYVETTHTLTGGTTHQLLIKVWDANGHLVQGSETVKSQ